jgi:purine-binding chemotaxis protein CheW
MRTAAEHTRSPSVAGVPSGPASAALGTLVEVWVAGQACGIPVLAVRDVLDAQAVTRVPLAMPEIAGSLNLRGRVVTVVDLRRRLGLPAEKTRSGNYVVVELGGELYALAVDKVTEVASLPGELFERTPPHVPQSWAAFSEGVFRLPDRLLIVLSVAKLLDIGGG